ncbi:MAG: UDP-4-amino-4,6-dideoxy-N-acetyl-beta-L-altrosamine transaminase [Glaciecola sp.]|jgi:UDP-4-amino-4,6-dideoxy-N-acetyl-beta-L-altrosamine transaminase
MIIPYGKHHIDQADIDAVVDVLENHFLTQGSKVPEFEQALCDYTGAKHCTAVNSATSGLHIACLAAGVGEGDVVWTTPNSFVASANCAIYCGAEIDFVDIDAQTRNIDIALLAQKLSEAKKANRLPKAIVVVHFAGFSCDMKAIASLLEDTDICLIEDAAHGLGGTYAGTKIGSCVYSDMAVLSFHPVKSLTTAEGGAVMTNSADYAQQLVLFGKHGITRDRTLMQSEGIDLEQQGGWFYQQVSLGFNYRLSDMQAALGISQLRKLDDFIAARQARADTYFNELQDLALKLPINDAENQSGWHLFMIELLHHDRQSVFQQLQEKGIGVNVHYIPIHVHPFYQKMGFKYGDFPVSEKYYEKAITIPLFPSLSADEQYRVVEVLKEVLA